MRNNIFTFLNRFYGGDIIKTYIVLDESGTMHLKNVIIATTGWFYGRHYRII